jgi:hypothetical protein
MKSRKRQGRALFRQGRTLFLTFVCFSWFAVFMAAPMVSSLGISSSQSASTGATRPKPEPVKPVYRPDRPDTPAEK